MHHQQREKEERQPSLLLSLALTNPVTEDPTPWGLGFGETEKFHLTVVEKSSF